MCIATGTPRRCPFRGPDESAYGEREKAGLKAVLAHLSLALENRWRLRQSGDLTTVMMGIVSNGGSLATIVVFFFMRAFASWGPWGLAYIALSAAALAAITTLLVIAWFSEKIKASP